MSFVSFLVLVSVAVGWKSFTLCIEPCLCILTVGRDKSSFCEIIVHEKLRGKIGSVLAEMQEFPYLYAYSYLVVHHHSFAPLAHHYS